MNINFNRTSWHYKLATAGGFYEDNEGNNDICTYTRSCIKAVIVGVFLTALYTFVCFLFWEVVFGIAFSLWFGVWLMSPWGAAILFLLGVGLAVFTVMAIGAGISHLKDKRREYRINNPKPDGFIKHAYKSMSEKYCARITFSE